MPQGHSIATCSECGRPYITGDCIMIGGTCEQCKSGEKLSTLMNVNLEEEMKVLSDAVQSIKKKQKKTLKNDISLILHGALSGETKEYRTDDGFVRWGLVEQDMFKAIDKCFEKELDGND